MPGEQSISELELHAYADGRLAEDRRAAVEAWLQERPGDAERVAVYRHLRKAIRAAYDPVLHQPIPRQLEGARATRPRWRKAAMVAASFAFALLAGWQLHDWQYLAAPSAGSGVVLAHRAAVAHATYAPEVRHPVEVRADQEQHLVAWLSKRLGMKLRAPALQQFGLSLVGGRLLPGEVRPVALLMYENSVGRRVTVYVAGDGGGRAEAGLHYARDNQVNVFYWIDAHWACAVASADISREDLQRIADEAYRQLES